ncbi:hypothetical protein Tco_1270206, partial [Tanacetum coccineum]
SLVIFFSSSGDQNLKDNSPDKTIDISNCLSEEVIDQSAIPSDDIMNVDCDDESKNKGNHCDFEDVVHAYPNLSEFNGLTEQLRLLTNQVTSLVNEHQNMKDQINKLHTSSAPSIESFVAEVVKGVCRIPRSFHGISTRSMAQKI